MIHVFIGTKAQYIKTAPLLRLMDERDVAYRLIDSGQHARMARGFREELGLREPDYALGGAGDVASIRRALLWSLSLARRLWSGAALRRDVFGGEGGVCVVHGDTPSTLLSALMARRAGLGVAHLEAGLRSHRLLHPFPEEIIRIITMRLSSHLFAPDEAAVSNLRAMGVNGRVVALSGNTSLEAVRWALSSGQVEAGSGPVIVTMHRVENLHNSGRIEGLVELIEEISRSNPVRFVIHEPTMAALQKKRFDERLRAGGVELHQLSGHQDFVRMLASAPFVVTDGGSIQEECALLGVPTMLWRMGSERPDGLEANVVVTGYDDAVVQRFLDDPESHRKPIAEPDVNPSEEILSELIQIVEN